MKTEIPEEWIRAVARAIALARGDHPDHWERFKLAARDALTVAIPLVAERCAKVADDLSVGKYRRNKPEPARWLASDIAEAIRADAASLTTADE